MSEVQTRPVPSTARGRGSSSRGGRAGSSFTSRSGGSARGAAVRPNGADFQTEITDEQSELAQLKKRYANELSTLQDMFPNLAPEEIIFELQENDGDLQTTADKISEGQSPSPPPLLPLFNGFNFILLLSFVWFLVLPSCPFHPSCRRRISPPHARTPAYLSFPSSNNHPELLRISTDTLFARLPRSVG